MSSSVLITTVSIEISIPTFLAYSSTRATAPGVFAHPTDLSTVTILFIGWELGAASGLGSSVRSPHEQASNEAMIAKVGETVVFMCILRQTLWLMRRAQPQDLIEISGVVVVPFLAGYAGFPEDFENRPLAARRDAVARAQARIMQRPTDLDNWATIAPPPRRIALTVSGRPGWDLMAIPTGASRRQRRLPGRSRFPSDTPPHCIN